MAATCVQYQLTYFVVTMNPGNALSNNKSSANNKVSTFSFLVLFPASFFTLYYYIVYLLNSP